MFDLDVSLVRDGKSVPVATEDLAIALAQNTDLKALVVNGYQDLAADDFLSRYLLEQEVRVPAARQRLAVHTCTGGHMSDLARDGRAEPARDVRSFFEATP